MPVSLAAESQTEPHLHDDIIYPNAIPFLLVHIACLAAFWTGVSVKALTVAVILYVVRMFGVTAGFHRYFSHRTFKTSRTFQFLLGLLAETSAQRGILWWASKHRDHHKHSDSELDIHSPIVRGFFYSHIGWIYSPKGEEMDYSNVKDLEKYPELRWLDKHIYAPAIALAIACFLFGGWQMLVVGFLFSTVALYHGTFAINSLAHVWGRKKYFTGDHSRNNWFLAIITLGEGWHNNHHYYMASARQGFRWYEFDPTYYVLVLLQKLHIIWDLREPSEAVINGERRLSRELVKQAAEKIKAQVHGLALTEQELEAKIRALIGNSPSVADVAAAIKGEQSVPALAANQA
ncbi:MAG: fatty acid desaturase [Armatimonadetes bacterium]|nr:fatty acid desaturase [Armatimonadota bacterium]